MANPKEATKQENAHMQGSVKVEPVLRHQANLDEKYTQLDQFTGRDQLSSSKCRTENSKKSKD